MLLRFRSSPGEGIRKGEAPPPCIVCEWQKIRIDNRGSGAGVSDVIKIEFIDVFFFFKLRFIVFSLLLRRRRVDYSSNSLKKKKLPLLYGSPQCTVSNRLLLNDFRFDTRVYHQPISVIVYLAHIVFPLPTR